MPDRVGIGCCEPLKGVLPGAKLRKYGHAVGERPARMPFRCAADDGLSCPQERIGQALFGDRGRKRRQAALALRPLAYFARQQRLASLLYDQSELEVRKRVLVAAIDADRFRKRGE